MYIETVPNRNSPPAVLLRESYRDGGKIKKRTLLNLSSWPAEQVEGLRIVLKGGTALPPGQDPFTMTIKLDRVVLAGDRGMITDARIREELEPAGLDWITALRAPAIQALAADNGPLQMSLFDERDMAEISSPDFPGERLVVCRNHELAGERTRKRCELLNATERDLAGIEAAVNRKWAPLRGQDKIGLAVGAVIGKHKMAKHFELAIEDASFTFRRKEDEIAAEARLDGLYVIRTSLPKEAIGAEDAVSAYKSLSQVERASNLPARGAKVKNNPKIQKIACPINSLSGGNSPTIIAGKAKPKNISANIKTPLSILDFFARYIFTSFSITPLFGSMREW